VVERALRVRGLESVLVATDDERIMEAVASFGGVAVMTPRSCSSGSDRVWHAVRDTSFDVILNIQGDEPALKPEGLEAVLGLMASHAELGLATLVSPLRSEEEYRNPNVVKAALGEGGRCLYFSRSPVPYLRARGLEDAPVYKHVGVYAYRKEILEAFTSWPPSGLESAECLEQLRALEHGVDVSAVVVDWPCCGVDEPADVAAAEAALAAEAGSGLAGGGARRGGDR